MENRVYVVFINILGGLVFSFACLFLPIGKLYYRFAILINSFMMKFTLFRKNKSLYDERLEITRNIFCKLDGVFCHINSDSIITILMIFFIITISKLLYNLIEIDIMSVKYYELLYLLKFLLGFYILNNTVYYKSNYEEYINKFMNYSKNEKMILHLKSLLIVVAIISLFIKVVFYY